ncbi:transglycosylase SLT domain-containing protein [Marinomonas atlantica]|uniref:transglycosylase SLT domain-containing protein n=1 Tax=Marinomonas atlantica TaxID=1806668 RepID=UPI00082F3B0A|nr:transglycosylase SLT domain-containing protein [Marinomonas atlantica]
MQSQMPKLSPVAGSECWLLLEDWFYTSLSGVRYCVPKGFITNLDSVPRIPVIYALYKGRVRAGAVLHDYLYKIGHDRKAADELLIEVGKIVDLVEQEYLDNIYMAVRALGWTLYEEKQHEQITTLDDAGRGGSDSDKKALKVEAPVTTANTAEPAPVPTPATLVNSTQSPLIQKTTWALPASAAQYFSDIRYAEYLNGIPSGLLGRLLYQESRFRSDIISGATKSSAGAVGIAQIVPRWHPDVDPTDPKASISYAGRYLAKLKKNFGSWETALAAYNWGWGNVTNAKQEYGSNWLSHAPTETQNYVSQIWGDIA